MAKKYLSVFNDGTQDLTIKDAEAQGEMGRAPYYCTCTTAASTAAKVITPQLETGSVFTLKKGTLIVVSFNNTNTASSPTFNVASGGAVGVKFNGTVISSSDKEYGGESGCLMTYIYDGTNWCFVAKSKAAGGNSTRILYADLVTLKGNSGLIPGQWYRITDYVTTTVQSDTQSAGHQFDVIVRADDVNVLNENAYAALHDGDTYFSTAGARLEAWELKYCLNNDTTKFEWADGTNGKGVIYWMKDENSNECPYDFKNIQFKWTSAIAESSIKANVFYYTFSVATGTNDATVTDHSLNGGYCHANKIGLYVLSKKQRLNGNVFRNMSNVQNCYSNSFGNGCYSNSFGNGCFHNIFGDKYANNKVANAFSYNISGNNCSGNTFRYNCASNSFGNGFKNNTLLNDCYNNLFGNDCTYCFFSSFCSYNKYGNGVRSVTIGKSYSQFIIVEDGNRYISLNCSATTSSSSLFQNVKIAQGVNNTNTTKTITHATAGDTFQTIYKPTNSVEVSV